MKENLTGQNRKKGLENLKVETKTENEWIKCCTCFILDEKGNVLVEKRAPKGLNPGKYDLCSGHVEKGEAPAQAMIRELNEELGVSNEKAINIIKLLDNEQLDLTNSSLNMKVFVSIYALKLKNQENFILQKQEVESIQWMEIEKFFELLEQGKTRFPHIGEKYQGIKNKVIEISKNIKNEKEISR